ncbi:unnamed protein product [Closterium sp. Naga37s-1]|nr:unnamed protein product [Closterium sp. Naga37s-1]
MGGGWRRGGREGCREQKGLRGGVSEAELGAVGGWQGREWWVQGEAVRGAVEDGRWALYCHLLDHLRFTRHGGADRWDCWCVTASFGVLPPSETSLLSHPLLPYQSSAPPPPVPPFPLPPFPTAPTSPYSPLLPPTPVPHVVVETAEAAQFTLVPTPTLPPPSPPLSQSHSMHGATTAGAPLAWLQGLLRRGSASSAGGAGSGDSGMDAVVRIVGAGVGKGGGQARVVGRASSAGGVGSGDSGMSAAVRVALRVQGMRRVGGPVGLVRCSVVGSRWGELRQLRGWKLVVVVALELSDLLLPLVKAAVTAAGRAVSFLLVALIVRSLGLVYQGIRQSWGQAL